MRVGIAHHLGWAVAVIAGAGHAVADRRRIELVEPGVGPAPVEHDIGDLGDGAAGAVGAAARAAALRATAAATAAALGQLARALPEPVTSLSVRAWARAPVRCRTARARRWGPPGTTGHRMALAATVMAS